MAGILLTALAVALMLPAKWRRKTGPVALACVSLAALAALAEGGSMHDALLCVLCPLPLLFLSGGKGEKT